MSKIILLYMLFFIFVLLGNPRSAICRIVLEVSPYFIEIFVFSSYNISSLVHDFFQVEIGRAMNKGETNNQHKIIQGKKFTIEKIPVCSKEGQR